MNGGGNVPKAKVTTNAINDCLEMINRLGGNIEEVAKRAVYEGAKIIADEIGRNIDALPIDEHWGTRENPLHGVRKFQKDGLSESFGIAPMRNDKGLINTRLGFDHEDYNSHGQANAMIARAVNSGTSFSEKIPFFENAVRATRAQARKKMVEAAENELEKITKE